MNCRGLSVLGLLKLVGRELTKQFLGIFSMNTGGKMEQGSTELE
jgi:hypothetical protein